MEKPAWYKWVRDPWNWHPAAARSRRRLEECHNRHVGETGVVMATGPSLAGTDLAPYRRLPTIGLNRIYLGRETLGLELDYLVCVNDLLLQQRASEIEALGLESFIAWSARRQFNASDNITYLHVGDGEEFQPDLTRFTPVGATVTYVALQLAYWMGFSTVYLLGLDHSYDLEPHEQGLRPHDRAERQADDSNHFHPDYFGRGAHWQLPDLQASERAYANARAAFEAAGRRIINATPGSKLDVFERGMPRASEASLSSVPGGS